MVLNSPGNGFITAEVLKSNLEWYTPVLHFFLVTLMALFQYEGLEFSYYGTYIEKEQSDYFC